MANEVKRDGWDKMEVIIKFFNGIVITALTVAIGCGTQKVADSIKYGELSQKLIQDLAMKDSTNHVRRDLSLITLNRTIGDENPQMLADMAEVIYLSDSAKTKDKNIARKILQERDRKRYDSITMQINRQRLVGLAEAYVRSSAISSPNATAADSVPLPAVANPAVQEINKTLAGSAVTIVYLQTNKNKEHLKPLADTLKILNFQVPQIETIPKPFRSGVRYFNAEDATKAADLAKLVFGRRLTASLPPVSKLKNPDNVIPVGQIEVWIKQ